MMTGDTSTMKYHDNSEWDDFCNDLYAFPESAPAQSSNSVIEVSPASKIDEENKIKALVETPALDWSRQGQDTYGGGRGFGRGMGGRMMTARGYGRGGFERKTPPVGYICHRCKLPGHFIQHCPTNGDPTYDIRKVKAPTGIPKSMLMATPVGSYMLPGGAAAVLKPNEAAFDKEVDGLHSTRPVSHLPPELRCPICREVMKDAVLASKCCFISFCDKCIRDYILTKSVCLCGATNVLADYLLPNKTLRDTISRILELTSSSTENAGTVVHVKDMESACPVQPKVPSPALSAASKDEPKKTPPIEYSSDVKVAAVTEGDAASEGKGVNDLNHSLGKKTPKNTDTSEATPESITPKDPISPESAPVPEEVQEKLLGDPGKKKKKKKTRMPSNAADLQWDQDLGVENYAAAMPLAPTVFNPYWNGDLPMGMVGFMTPFGGGMPYMGCAPGPLDVPLAGMLPQDPFAVQGYMMQGFPPRDLSELGMGMGMNQRPPMSRVEFEAMKADIRKKREFERLNERENTRDAKVNSCSAESSSVKLKPRSVSQAERFDWSDREGSEKTTAADRPSKRRPSDEDRRHRHHHHGGDSSSVTTAADAAEKKQKGSIFSRISFPADDGNKKRKVSSSLTLENPKEHHGHSRRDERDAQRKGVVAALALASASASASAAPSSNGYMRRRSSYDQDESSEEEEYHFKRKPSSSTSRREEREKEDDSRHN